MVRTMRVGSTETPEVAMRQFDGVHVALTTPFDPEDLEVDLDAFRSHCAWLLDEGITGLFPNGSLGEYEALSPVERRSVWQAAVEVAEGRGLVVSGLSGPSARAICDLAEQARSDGVDGAMVLPPTNHPSTIEELVAHYSAIAEVGLPVIAYNNPFSTRTDLTPDILARLARIDGVVGVKEFSGDVRRVSEIIELAPGLEVLCGSDDLGLESTLMGATGWIGGFTATFPAATVRLFEAGRAGNVGEVLDLYRTMLPALRWDSGPQFVQAIKLSIDLVGGSAGGPTRPPRLPLPDADAARVEQAVSAIQAVIA
jgi:1-pyrroline-4-hydroxy-2-carboxylate deaminase